MTNMFKNSKRKIRSQIARMTTLPEAVAAVQRVGTTVTMTGTALLVCAIAVLVYGLVTAQ